ncbi:alpha-L-glutamate ligase [Microbacterium betulae]|uniref:Alpha-L-glutamate ligase n=1 Tax=Microbacterium betulae TaxID=2981139 RepID=A0AA97FI69_9MICO|nr:alpha-L-glutamate ligase [Microbacterium sp. AB]WOF23148.1 alpha-L-glutamate ligase [Microbacterium sp. AB]
MTAVYVLHDNPDWIPAFARAFEAEGVPLREWRLGEGVLDLDAEPPQGVFWSRLSASSHTRGAERAKDAARATLSWLESWGRRVVNGSAVASFEVSKAAQHAALRRAGFDVPRTVAVFGREGLSEAARGFDLPFITKHNQGGKGLGVRRFDDYAAFDAYVESTEFEEPADGITLLQEFLPSAEPFVTRAEFIGGRFAYAVRVDTSAGGFELCPAEACAVPEAGVEPEPLFRVRPEVTADDPLIRGYEELLAQLGIEIAGIEFLTTSTGRTVTYDINTNTNYSPDVEAAIDDPATRRVARFLGGLLAPAPAAV